MPTQFLKGDILQAQAQAIVIPVNCVGAMGAGLALQAAQRDRRIERDYHRQQGQMVPGSCCHYFDMLGVCWFYFPTKYEWKEPSELVYIELGMEALVEGFQRIQLNDHFLTSIAIPALGCGLGGLDWKDVLPLIQKPFEKILPQVDLMIYPPK